MKINRISRIVVAVLFVISFLGVNAQPTFAIGGVADYDFYENSNIRLLDPNDTSCGVDGGIEGVEIGGGELPSETVKYLDGANVKSLVNSSMARYKYAEEKTKVPWQAMAALHYREGRNNPETTILNGVKLGSGINVDGVNVVADANEDAVNAAKIFIGNAKGVYSVDVTKPETLKAADWGKAFLAYNRGYLYLKNNKTFDQSPYVMNGYDDNHLNMSWVGPPADPAVSGADGNKAGALAVFQYLGGSAGNGCSANTGNIIVDTALKFVRETPATNGMNDPGLAKPAYREAIQKYNGAAPVYPQITDCGRFVSTVMRASGADPSFYTVGVGAQENYMTNSGKYTNLGRASAGQLKAGDILTAHGAGTTGHIIIFTGPIGPPENPGLYMAVDASFYARVPSVRPFGGVSFMMAQSHYVAWRLNSPAGGGGGGGGR